jgi:hypothetical protein
MTHPKLQFGQIGQGEKWPNGGFFIELLVIAHSETN